MLEIHLRKLLKEIQYHSPFRRNFFPSYAFNFTVSQLMFLCQCVIDTQSVEGSVMEIGSHQGATTVFLNKLLDDLESEKLYYAIDTFSGFVRSDVEFEVNQRGKNYELFRGTFEVNSKRWFDGTMEQNGIGRVTSIAADVNNYDFSANAPYSFALLDVDLYQPIKKSIGAIYDVMSTGGIIVVDDCDEKNLRWDGSDQAFKDFVKEMGIPAEIVCGKLGVIRKTKT